MTPEEQRRQWQRRGQRLYFETLAICLVFATGVIVGLRALSVILR